MPDISNELRYPAPLYGEHAPRIADESEKRGFGKGFAFGAITLTIIAQIATVAIERAC